MPSSGKSSKPLVTSAASQQLEKGEDGENLTLVKIHSLLLDKRVYGARVRRRTKNHRRRAGGALRLLGENY